MKIDAKQKISFKFSIGKLESKFHDIVLVRRTNKIEVLAEMCWLNYKIELVFWYAIAVLLHNAEAVRK